MIECQQQRRSLLASLQVACSLLTEHDRLMQRLDYLLKHWNWFWIAIRVCDICRGNYSGKNDPSYRNQSSVSDDSRRTVRWIPEYVIKWKEFEEIIVNVMYFTHRNNFQLIMSFDIIWTAITTHCTLKQSNKLNELKATPLKYSVLPSRINHPSFLHDHCYYPQHLQSVHRQSISCTNTYFLSEHKEDISSL